MIDFWLITSQILNNHYLLVLVIYDGDELLTHQLWIG